MNSVLKAQGAVPGQRCSRGKGPHRLDQVRELDSAANLAGLVDRQGYRPAPGVAASVPCATRRTSPLTRTRMTFPGSP
jgi:hypothetical protein